MFSWTKKREEKRIAEEQEIKEKRAIKEKYRQVFIAFRNTGERFTFLGYEMLVMSHEIKDNGWYLQGIIKTAYIDKAGSILYKDFLLDDIPVLMVENNYPQTAIEEARQQFFLRIPTELFLEGLLSILQTGRP